ncbi:MAG: LPS assembly lipoprotein LptE [Candidatus Omnitrophica bacterium]|nr:LPS assembly lipoprotein LptE [Candidatus Omnitrophota bacterium]
MKKILIIPLVFFLTGCGYTTRSQVMERYKTIYIRQFQNKIDMTSESSASRRLKTYYPAIETELTKAVIERFIWDGSMRPTREEDADLVLKGEVTEFRRDALSYIETTKDVEKYRISLVVNISLIDKKENKLLWQESNLVGDTTYFTQGQFAQTEESAIQQTVRDLARRIVERVVEDW